VGGLAELSNQLPKQVVSLPETTIIPGMIDAHVHLTLAGDHRTYEEMMFEPDEMLTLIGVSNLTKHLTSGVTTVRDNGGRNKTTFSVREAARRGYFPAPRLLLSGRPITPSGGHFHWCNGVADGLDEIRLSVRKLVSEGADHIKIMASGGGTEGISPSYPTYDSEELSVAVRTAHDLGRPTTAHCRAKSSMIRSLDAGLDCIEHGEFLVEAPLRDFGHGIAPAGKMEYDPAVVHRMLETDTFLSFTMQAGGYDSLVALRDRSGRGESLEAHEIARRDALEEYFEMKLQIFSRLLNDGMRDRLVVSSDAGPFDAAFGRLQWNLELAVEAGMDPIQALRSVTEVAARACGVADMVGTIERGKKADLVVVAGDPTVDIARVADVRAVFMEGRLVAPLNAAMNLNDGESEI
jgi:imidazolonepropionase-like amidohydrolase